MHTAMQRRRIYNTECCYVPYKYQNASPTSTEYRGSGPLKMSVKISVVSLAVSCLESSW